MSSKVAYENVSLNRLDNRFFHPVFLVCIEMYYFSR